MTDISKNPSGDLYKIMDKSGLTLANLQRPDQSQTKTVQQVRIELHDELRRYIKEREKIITDGQITISATPPNINEVQI